MQFMSGMGALVVAASALVPTSAPAATTAMAGRPLAEPAVSEPKLAPGLHASFTLRGQTFDLSNYSVAIDPGPRGASGPGAQHGTLTLVLAMADKSRFEQADTPFYAAVAEATLVVPGHGVEGAQTIRLTNLLRVSIRQVDNAFEAKFTFDGEQVWVMP